MITIIFSKDRSLQCDLTLRSLVQNCNENANIHVLYSCSDKRHEKSYETLSKEHPEATFHRERDFKQDLLELIKSKGYILFSVDDNIFINKFSIDEIVGALKDNPRALGFSLRLGANTDYCYSLNCKQNMPGCIKVKDNILMFGWVDAEADYNYGLEVSSSLYKIKDIFPILCNTNYGSPNDLEWDMFQCLPMFKKTKPLLLSYETSVAFCNPINKIQKTNDNRCGNLLQFSTDSLLTEYEKCGTIRYCDFDGFVSNACHQEVNINIDYRKG